MEITARDALGRELRSAGETRNRIANQATPGMFSWMSIARWTGSAGACTGQDQEIWSPDTWPIPGAR